MASKSTNSDLVNTYRNDLIKAIGSKGFKSALESERLYEALSKVLQVSSTGESRRQKEVDLCYLSHAFTAINLDERVQSSVRKICGGLEGPDLMGVLKWPVCVGEKEILVLSELEKRFEQDPGAFKGNAWKFVAFVESIQRDGSVDSEVFSLPSEDRVDVIEDLDLGKVAQKPTLSDWFTEELRKLNVVKEAGSKAIPE